jgi:hypothetical protein
LAGGMEISSYLYYLAMLAAGGAFMAAAGVGIGLSLSGVHTTRGMALIVLVWMATAVISLVMAALLSVVTLLLSLLFWATYALTLSSSPQTFSAGPTYLDWFWGAAFVALRVGLYLAATAALILWIASKFDRLAGRMGSWSISQRVLKSLEELNAPLSAAAVPVAAVEDCQILDGDQSLNVPPEVVVPEPVYDREDTHL